VPGVVLADEAGDLLHLGDGQNPSNRDHQPEIVSAMIGLPPFKITFLFT
jgi:hypothetical protein